MLRKAIMLLIAITVAISSATSALSEGAAEATPGTGEAVPIKVKIETTPTATATSMQVRFDPPAGVRNLPFDTALKSAVSAFKAGDYVEITVDNPKDPKKLVTITAASVPVPAMAPFIAIFGSMAAVLALLFLLMRDSPLKLILGEDNRYSNSKAQIAVWALSVISVYLGAVALRYHYLGDEFVGGVEIPANLLLLSGFSAFSFGAAKAITSTKVNNAIPAGTPAENKEAETEKIKSKADEKRDYKFLLDDLFKNDKDGFDLGDTQMLLITMIVVGLFLLDGLVFLRNLNLQAHVTLPEVDTTLLSAFGLGQGAYLFKKAAGEPGKS